MEKTDEEFIISLLDRDADLKRYYEEHQELEKRLQEFQHKNHLTAAEEVEKKRLQKLKLSGKDKIMEILVRYRQVGVHREIQ